jgi:hypothetical protein
MLDWWSRLQLKQGEGEALPSLLTLRRQLLRLSDYMQPYVCRLQHLASPRLALHRIRDKCLKAGALEVEPITWRLIG